MSPNWRAKGLTNLLRAKQPLKRAFSPGGKVDSKGGSCRQTQTKAQSKQKRAIGLTSNTDVQLGARREVKVRQRQRRKQTLRFVSRKSAGPKILHRKPKYKLQTPRIKAPQSPRACLGQNGEWHKRTKSITQAGCGRVTKADWRKGNCRRPRPRMERRRLNQRRRVTPQC